MNKRQHKKLVDKIERTTNTLKLCLDHSTEPGMLIMHILHSSTGDVASLLGCRKSQAYLIQKVTKMCAIVIEKSWDRETFDWVLYPTTDRVLDLGKRQKLVDVYLNEDGNTDPHSWEHQQISVMTPGEYRNFRHSAFLI